MTDLLVRNAALLATCDAAGRELAGGWVAVTDGLVSGVGAAGEPPPEAARTIDAAGCLVTPGLVNTHHHIYQNLTRSFAPALNGTLFEWLTRLYPVWAGLDEEASYLSAWVGLAELALGGCTSTADHLYVAPARRRRPVVRRDRRGPGAGAALPPDPRLDDAVGEGRRAAARLGGAGRRHDPRRLRAAGRGAPRPVAGAMLRVALAPCSPFSVTPELMRRPPSWPSGSTSGCTPTSPRTPTRTRTASTASAAAPSTSSRRSAGGPRGPGWRTASTRTRPRSRGSAPRAPASRTARART